MSKTIILVLGVVFVLVGILGWIPNPLVGSAGVFMTDHAHDVVHLVTGLVFLAVGLWASMQSALTMKIFGVIYLLVAILGFIMGEGSLLGLIDINAADNWLHLVLGVTIFGLGWWSNDDMM